MSATTAGTSGSLQHQYIYPPTRFQPLPIWRYDQQAVGSGRGPEISERKIGIHALGRSAMSPEIRWRAM